MSQFSIPEYKTIKSIPFQLPAAEMLNNKIPLFFLASNGPEIMDLNVLIRHSNLPVSGMLEAGATAAQLREGTTNRKRKLIYDKLDFYGVRYSVSVQADFTLVSAIFLSKYAEEVLSLLSDMLINPVFPEKSLDLYKKRAIERVKVSKQKVEYHAGKISRKCLFGTKHIYGFTAEEKDISRLRRKQLIDFHKKQYHAGNISIFLASNGIPRAESLLGKFFSTLPVVKQSDCKTDLIFHPADEKNHYHKMENPFQSSIALVKHIAERDSEDYNPLSLLTSILGGYFGARLMKNLREEKGFTYGIYSTLRSYANANYFSLRTEVAAQHTDAAYNEIIKEILKLRTSLVSIEELQLVRNYLMGSLMRSIDGPNKILKRMIHMQVLGQDKASFQRFIESVHQTTPEQLMTLAEKYFDPDSFYHIVAGSKT